MASLVAVKASQQNRRHLTTSQQGNNNNNNNIKQWVTSLTEAAPAPSIRVLMVFATALVPAPGKPCNLMHPWSWVRTAVGHHRFRISTSFRARKSLHFLMAAASAHRTSTVMAHIEAVILQSMRDCQIGAIQTWTLCKLNIQTLSHKAVLGEVLVYPTMKTVTTCPTIFREKARTVACNSGTEWTSA